MLDVSREDFIGRLASVTNDHDIGLVVSNAGTGRVTADRLKDQFSKERHVVLVLCGGNMPFEDLARLPGAQAQ